MAAPTISEYLSYANLQMAAEAFIRDERTNVLNNQGLPYVTALTNGNLHASRFVESQAKKFADEWEVLDQKANTKTGFSGTLFRNRETREVVLSFRSTEFIDDAALDNKATNELEIKNTGYAWGQIADMQAWYAELKADPNKLGGGQAFSVTGYSLGGHLATAFNLMNAGAAQRVVTFNGAGVGKVLDGTLQSALAEFNTLRGSTDELAARFTEAGLAGLYRRIQGDLAAGRITAVQAQAQVKEFYTDTNTGQKALPQQDIENQPLYREGFAMKKEAKNSMDPAAWMGFFLKSRTTSVKALLKKARRSGAWRHSLACMTLALAGCMGSGGPVGAAAADGTQAAKVQQPLKERQRIAAEMFRERCKKAGVFIHRTVEDVEGVFLMKIRPEEINFGKQYVLDDPYGRDLGGDAYIKSFLRGHFQHDTKQGPNRPPDAPADPLGYTYAEAIDPKDGVRYRYTGSVVEPWRTDKSYLQGYTKFVLQKSPSAGQRPRYGVTYDDISTNEERDYWIAGSSLRVIDLETNEVIAERIGYMVDWAQGITVGGRSPWLLAADNACPKFADRRAATSQLDQATRFVNKSLKPKEAE
ncbi:hypothetical protein [Acidovorax sp. NCPPB 4044]|uniref:hypothetical protein n=1 Tax=Acidovorax sp. NCPPB 4044 TaxID=2940490 RepID=UPI00230209C6|nr:hypothetical protein [Acidovorax sp. NCPPB 4044]MDA8520454.1 hypothetical protein [Acidovorax sp. NCPPB 4044]